jgi:AsmA protein
VNVIIRIKRIAAAALILAIGCVAVLLILPYTVPRHEIRAAVTRALNAVTDAAPRIGATHFSVLPRPGLRFEDVRFGERLSAGSLRASIKLLPLLLGEVEVSSLTFEDARLDIEFGPDGARLLGLPLRAPGPDAAGLPDIRLVNSTVNVRSTDSRQAERLSGVEASIAWSGTGLGTNASFRWRDMPGTINLHIADTAALGENARSPIRFRFESDLLRASFEGSFAFRKGLQADGGLSVESKSLRTLLAAFGIDVPTRGGFEALSLKSRAQITPASLIASGLSISLDGNRADGTLTLAIENKRPVLQGTLAAESTDFSPYMRGFTLVTDARDWSKESLDVKSLAGFDLDLRLSAGKVILGKTEASRVALAAAVKEGRFTLSAGEAQVFGGLLRGNAAIGPAQDGNGADVRLSAVLQDFDTAQGIAAAIGNRPLDGVGTFSTAISGSGASVSAITHSLLGSAELTVQNGALQGVNVESALKTLTRKPLAAMSELRGGRTPFDRFVAKLAIKGGDASFEQAQIESQSVAVTLKGLASIPNRDLDLKGVASLVTAPGATNGVALPFLVRGSWDSPRLAPDGPALLRRSDFEFVKKLTRQASFLQ